MALTSHSAGQKMSEDWLRFDGTEKILSINGRVANCFAGEN